MNSKNRLEQILSTMDIPEYRREINFGNISWMTRNLSFRNRDNENYEEAMKLVKMLYKELI